MSSQAPLIDHPRVRAWLEIRGPLERQLEPFGRAAMAALAKRDGPAGPALRAASWVVPARTEGPEPTHG